MCFLESKGKFDSFSSNHFFPSYSTIINFRLLNEGGSHYSQ